MLGPGELVFAGTSGLAYHLVVDGGAPATPEDLTNNGAIVSTPSVKAAWATGQPGEAWLVGYSGFVSHRVDGGWSSAFLPAGDLNAIHGAAPDEFWVVGNGPLIRHYIDGGFTSLQVDAGSANFNAVWAAAPNDVWIAGTGELFHWDGCSFTRVVSPLPGDQINAMVGRVSTDIWAVTSSSNVLKYGP